MYEVIAGARESYRSHLLSRLLNDLTDDKLIIELRKRRYDLSKLRENDEKESPTGEIVKIG